MRRIAGPPVKSLSFVLQINRGEGISLEGIARAIGTADLPILPRSTRSCLCLGSPVSRRFDFAAGGDSSLSRDLLSIATARVLDFIRRILSQLLALKTLNVLIHRVIAEREKRERGRRQG